MPSHNLYPPPIQAGASILRDALPLMRSSFGPQHTRVIEGQLLLSEAYRQLGLIRAAVQTAQQAAAMLQHHDESHALPREAARVQDMLLKLSQEQDLPTFMMPQQQ